MTATTTIGELAAETGVPPRMLRYYESQGLLAPSRAANGYRRYTAADADRVRQVRRLIVAGMPTRIIRVVLERENDPGWTEQCTRDFADELAGELAAVDERIACLESTRTTLRQALTTAVVDDGPTAPSSPAGRAPRTAGPPDRPARPA